MYDIKLNVMVSEKIREDIRKIAYKLETSMSEVIRISVIDFIKNDKKRENKIRLGSIIREKFRKNKF